MAARQMLANDRHNSRFAQKQADVICLHHMKSQQLYRGYTNSRDLQLGTEVGLGKYS